ncbi:Conserved_hypothetical protein [Hexamita inflata]|uniref:Uncharacterized protein n=1 Tax=Hexamita inflata TaxID=28002 RepID=A0AA86UQ50_9EUKA|nr:Conserved hypothetical protein [Hexamita inflata]
MQCQVCQQIIDVCKLIDSDSEDLPDKEPVQLIIPDEAQTICQKCYQKARQYQQYTLQQAKEQIGLLQCQIDQFQRQQSIPVFTGQVSDFNKYNEQLAKTDDSPQQQLEQHMHYDPDQSKFDPEQFPAQNSNLLKIKFDYYNKPVLRNLFSISEADCSFCGFRLSGQEHQPVSLDEINAGLIHVSYLLSYFQKRLQIDQYKFIPALPAPLFYIPTEKPGFYQFFYKYQNQIMKKIKTAQQSVISACCYTQIIGFLVQIAKKLEIQLPHAVSLPSWALFILNQADIERRRSEFVDIGVVLQSQFACRFEEYDYAVFDIEGKKVKSFFEDNQAGAELQRIFVQEVLAIIDLIIEKWQ